MDFMRRRIVTHHRLVTTTDAGLQEQDVPTIGATREPYEELQIKTQRCGAQPWGPIEKHIDVIVGGWTYGKDSALGQKAYARNVVEKRLMLKDESKITFEVREIEYSDHNDTLVVSVCIANTQVKRVMIDTRSSTDVLYFDAFQKLGLTAADLSPMSSTLTGFKGDELVISKITLI
ncbi:hypothetical protein B296_00005582 [Ensete ventricosum]|uniref:Uncharacterized protein n=1 Tax=Ensete ventricosum TaxID=4639 RepID=A0A427BBT5_ENSVE|nr:hypothetical protein B296_00005582 [Ensete ventricosum]